MLTEWLLSSLKESGVSQAALSRQLSERLGRSIDRAAVNKMTKGQRAIAGDELLQIEQITGIKAPSRSEAIENKPAPMRPVGAIPVIGKVRAGGWLEVDELDSEIDNDFPQIPASMEYPLEWQYAFTVEGNSINKIATEGDRLICIDMIQSGIAVMDNDLVIVERIKHEGSMIERTAKRVRKTSSGFDLWPESTDPDHQTPMALNGASSHEEVRVRAKVIWIMKKP